MASFMAHAHPHHCTSQTREAPVTPPSSPQPDPNNDNAIDNAYVSPLSRSAMLQSKRGSPPSPIDSPMAGVEPRHGGMTPPPSPIQSTPTLSRTIFSLNDAESTQSFHTPGDIESTHASKASYASSTIPPTVTRSSKRSSDAAVLDFINAYTRDTSSISQPPSTFPLCVLAHSSIQQAHTKHQAPLPMEMYHSPPLLERDHKRLSQSPKFGRELAVTDNGSPIRPTDSRRPTIKRNRPCATGKRRRALEVPAPPVPPLPKLTFVPPVSRIPLPVGPQRIRTREEIQTAIQRKPLPNPPMDIESGEIPKQQSKGPSSSDLPRESSAVPKNVSVPRTIRVIPPTNNEKSTLRSTQLSSTSTETTPTQRSSTARRLAANQPDVPSVSSCSSSDVNYYGQGGEVVVSHFDHDDDEEEREFLRFIKKTWKKQTERVKTTALELQQRLNGDKKLNEEDHHSCTDHTEQKWQKRLTVRLSGVKSKVTDSLRSCFGREEVVGYV